MKDTNRLNDEVLENVSGGMITAEEAMPQALEAAGLKKSQIEFAKRPKLDYEHGRKVYEISFYQGGFEYEFDVDAQNGNILKFEKDFD